MSHFHRFRMGISIDDPQCYDSFLTHYETPPFPISLPSINSTATWIRFIVKQNIFKRGIPAHIRHHMWCNQSPSNQLDISSRKLQVATSVSRQCMVGSSPSPSLLWPQLPMCLLLPCCLNTATSSKKSEKSPRLWYP